MPSEMITIPAGTFTMGHKKFPDASPQHMIALPKFRIGKYPVTNAEFAGFIAARGYVTEEFWTPMGWRWLQSRPQSQPGFWNDPRFSAPRQPVVGVAWYEAVAYCNWLKITFPTGSGGQTQGVELRLPTEAEWEKAARGTEDVRPFPWGPDYAPNHANVAELGLGRTTNVDTFPLGASPFGVRDLAGNVYEWTLSKWGANWQEMEFAYPYRADDGREDTEGSAARVMRGGSWFNSALEAQVWQRARFLPGSRGSNIGFRILQMERGQLE
jgi:formylglycine-generating enzyme required for sulfatase activity